MAPNIVPLLINDEEIFTKDRSFPVISSTANRKLWDASTASVSEAHNAVEAASSAFPGWAATTPATRRDIFLRAADIVERRQDEIVETLKLETSASEQFARDVQLHSAIDFLRDCAGKIAERLAGSLPDVNQEGQAAMILKQPYGVVLSVVPWNAAFILAIRGVIYPLAAGNTVILKGAELSPRCHYLLGDIFREAGLPKGCLNVIFHRPEDASAVTTALIEHPSVRKINFTGSAAVGKIVASTAGANLKPILLELGGKASAIILDDADIDLAARECALGAFLHAGQICMSTERILVHASILHAFRAALIQATESLFPSSSPAPFLVNERVATHPKTLVDDALSHGARIVHRGNNTSDPEEDSTTTMRPTILENVTPASTLHHAESFGPQVSLYAIDSDDAAVCLANDTEYGLSASVFSRDLGRALRVARRIESGAVHVNSMTVHDEPSLPHGGWKGSGYGRFGASVGIEEFVQLKVVTYMV